MWSRSSSEAAERCPFCDSPVPRRTWACAACHAEKRARKGMSPAAFRVFSGLWAALSAAVMLVALWLAVVPWTARGEPPEYALWLVGVRGEVPPASGCRVEIADASGHKREVVTSGSCSQADPALLAGQAPRADIAREGGPDMTTRRMASALHSLAMLAGGLLLCWLLLWLLRRFFVRRAPVSWVRRTA